MFAIRNLYFPDPICIPLSRNYEIEQQDDTYPNLNDEPYSNILKLFSFPELGCLIPQRQRILRET